MASAQDIPETPGRGDPGLEASGQESFGDALLTGAAAPADPWAVLAEQLEWELRRAAPPGPSPPLPAAADAAFAAAAGSSRVDFAAIEQALAGATSELPTKPSLPAPLAHYGQWRAQAQARGLRSVFIAAADDFMAAPPPTPGPELLAAMTATSAALAAAAAPSPKLPVAPNPALPPPPPQAERLSPRRAGGLLGAVQRPQAAPAAAVPTTHSPAPHPAPLPPPPQAERLSPRRAGGLLGAVQRPSPPAGAPLAAESAPDSAPLRPPSASRLHALVAEANQLVRQSTQRGKALLRRLLSADRGAAPPEPPTPD